MLLDYIHKVGWLVALLLLQALVLNNVHLGGYATPFLYIYVLLKFGPGISRCGLMVWAFVAGLAVDVLSDTPGMNTSAAVALAFVRPSVFGMFSPRDASSDGPAPGFRTMGVGGFLKYAAVCVSVYYLWLLLLAYFSFAHVWTLVLRGISGTVLTVACLMALEGVCQKAEGNGRI